MPEINEIISVIENIAPLNGACEWDNSGLIIGNGKNRTDAVVVALDFNEGVLHEAISRGAGLIVTHHPFIFGGIKQIIYDSRRGAIIAGLIKNDISVYAAHTNLDTADGGTNDALFDLLGLTEKRYLTVVGFALGRIGACGKNLNLKDYAARVKAILNSPVIKWAGDPEKTIVTVGFAAGSASGEKYFREAAANGCDVYITGDVSHHDAYDALNEGLSIIDAGHFATEYPVTGTLAGLLADASEKNNWGLKIYRANERDIFNYGTEPD